MPNKDSLELAQLDPPIPMDISVDLADAGLAALGQTPVVGTLLKLYRAGASFRDWNLLRKMKMFTEGVNPSEEVRLDFAGRLAGDHEFRDRVGEHLLTLLDSYDDQRKAKILGILFLAFMENRISHETLSRFARAIFHLHYSDIRLFTESGHRNPDHILDPLASSGLVLRKVSLVGQNPNLVWSVSKLGTTFRTLLKPHVAQLWPGPGSQ